MTIQRRVFVMGLATMLAISISGCNSKRRAFLSNTNPHVVLVASREVLAKVSAGVLKPGSYEFRRSPPTPGISQFPPAIRNLGCTRVVIHYEGYLTIEMAGSWDHFGVKAYPEDFIAPYADFIYGDRKLIDGLWYYDDEYIDNPGYDKKVERWIAKRRMSASPQINN